MENKSEQVVLVTGAARGIGKGISKHLVAEGMNVVLADIDGEAVEETAADLGDLAFPVQTDVSDEASVIDLFRIVRSKFGSLDALVNNAGITRLERTPVEQLDLSEWDRVLGTNLTGAFLCCKHGAALLRDIRGCIVNIASTRALQSEANTEAYSASKGGLVALTHALAMSLGPEIRVNCISPGWIVDDDRGESSATQEPVLSQEDHAQHPVGRVGNPEDIAAIVAFLMSSRAGFITGQNIVVDGGMTRKMIYAE